MKQAQYLNSILEQIQDFVFIDEACINLPSLSESLHAMIRETESTFSGWTSQGQIEYAREALRRTLLTNETDAINPKQSEMILQNLTDYASLLVYAKFLIQYTKSGDLAAREYYKNLYIGTQDKLNAKLGSKNASSLKEGMLKLASVRAADFMGVLHYADLSVNASVKPLAAFHTAEAIGHGIVYNYKDKETDKLEIEDPLTKKKQEYIRVPLRATTDTGKVHQSLIGEVLLPLTEEDEPTIYIGWAGTHSEATAKADTERAAGEESYRTFEDQLLGQIIPLINAHYEKTGKPAKIVFTGHSLGGALAQLNYNTMQRALAYNIAQKEKNTLLAQKVSTLETRFADSMEPYSMNTRTIDQLKRVKNLEPKSINAMSCDIWNAAGVLGPVEDSSNAYSSILVDQGIAQGGHFGLVHGDSVQMTGQGNILTDLENNKAEVNLLKINPSDNTNLWTRTAAALGSPALGAIVGHLIVPGIGGIVGGILCCSTGIAAVGTQAIGAHTAKHFNETLEMEPGKGVLLSSTRPHEREIITKELKTKSWVIDKSSEILSNFGLTGMRDINFHQLVQEKNNVGLQKALTKISGYYTGTFIDYTSKTNLRQDTPLHLIAQSGDIALWNTIASFNYKNYSTQDIVNLHAKDKAGKTPIEVAFEQGHMHLVEAMMKAYPSKEQTLLQEKFSSRAEGASSALMI